MGKIAIVSILVDNIMYSGTIPELEEKPLDPVQAVASAPVNDQHEDFPVSDPTPAEPEKKPEDAQ